MSTPKEIEIKLELSPATLPRLKKIPLMRSRKGATKRSAEVSVYFDTDKHTLRRKGLMLRVRRIGNRYIQTIKATGRSGLFERDEWESGIASAHPDLDLARGTALARAVCGFIAFFWSFRLVWQFFVYDVKETIQANTRWLWVGYHGLTVVFLYFAIVYGAAALS